MHVQMRSAFCMCTVASRHVTQHVVADDLDAVPVLRASVRSAYEELNSSPLDTKAVNAVLTALAAKLGCVIPHLHAVADAQPGGAVAAALGHLRYAFSHAAAGRCDHAVSAVAAAEAVGA
jgi:hypothetical protein